MYVLLMANCDELGQGLTLEGHTVWMNPYGYLPGEWYGDLPFHGAVALLYLALGAAWLALGLRRCRELLGIQMWATLVLGLGMTETATKYFDFLAWNDEGRRNLGAMVFGIIMGVSKRALSRILVLMAVLGYGVVKPSLGRTRRNVLALGGAYLVFSLAEDLLTHLPRADAELQAPSYVEVLLFVTLAIALVDVLFYVWTFQALAQTITYLSARKQTVKVTLYLRFRYVLVVTVLFAIAWAVYSVIMSGGNRLQEQWKDAWSVNAAWEVVYLFILLWLCILWRPSANNQRYAYSGLPTEEGTGIEIGWRDA
ncbi:unnamed protein product, partial [Heterosigma akashiwo]